MMVNRWVILLSLCLMFTASSWAQSVREITAEGTIEVLGEIGKALEVVVPAGVSSLVRTGPASSLKVEHVAGHIFITPLVKEAAEIVVMDSFARSYRLRFVFDKGHEERIVIRVKQKLEPDAQEASGSIRFISELAGGGVPVGAVEVDMQKVVFENEAVRIRAVRKYEMPYLAGYVLVAENLLPRPLVVPLEQFSFPGLLAVTSRQDILPPAGAEGSSGLMYMVTAR